MKVSALRNEARRIACHREPSCPPIDAKLHAPRPDCRRRHPRLLRPRQRRSARPPSSSPIARESNVGELDFTTPLQIPPLLDPETRRRWPQGVRPHPADRARPGSCPPARPRLGRERRLPRPDAAAHGAAKRSRSPSTTSCRRTPRIHWHGMHLPAAMDGGPHQMISAGETWTPAWTIDQPAATLWYHPHPHGQTAEHVYRGLAGLFLIDDDESDSARPAARLRGGRHPADRAGQAVHRRRRALDGHAARRVLGGASACWATRSLVNGTLEPVPRVTTRAGAAAAAQRLQRPLLQPRVRRRPAVLAGRHRRRACSGDPTSRAGPARRPASGPRSWWPCAGRRGGAAQLRRTTWAGARATSSAAATTPSTCSQFAGRRTLDDVAGAARRPDRNGGPPGRGRGAPPCGRSRSTAQQDQRRTWTWTGSTRSFRRARGGVEGHQPDGQPHNFHIHGVQFRVLEVDGREPGPALRAGRTRCSCGRTRAWSWSCSSATHTDPDMPVHVPLPHAAARGQGHDGPVRGGRTGHRGFCRPHDLQRPPALIRCAFGHQEPRFSRHANMFRIACQEFTLAT